MASSLVRVHIERERKIATTVYHVVVMWICVPLRNVQYEIHVPMRRKKWKTFFFLDICFFVRITPYIFLSFKWHFAFDFSLGIERIQSFSHISDNHTPKIIFRHNLCAVSVYQCICCTRKSIRIFRILLLLFGSGGGEQ